MGCRVVVAGCAGAGAREVEGSDDDDAADASVVDGNVGGIGDEAERVFSDAGGTEAREPFE